MDISSVSSYIDLYQTSQMGKPPAKPSIEDMTDRLIQDKDTDGSGGLSIDELCISEEAFAQADADSNGELDREELIANAETIGKELGPPPGMMGPPPGPQETLETEQTTLLDLIEEASEEETGVDLIA